MSAPDKFPFSGLFAPPCESPATITLHSLWKRGKPFLFVPINPMMAAWSLDLYPAQTPLARRLRGILRAALRARLPLRLRRINFTVSLKDPFVQFIVKSAGGNGRQMPSIAILAGNAAVEGRRFTLLVFSGDGTARTIIKAGSNPAAHHLIALEEAFLKSAPQNLRHSIPTLRDTFHSKQVSAIVLDFLHGGTPCGNVRPQLLTILSSWLDTTRVVMLGDIPAWRELQAHEDRHPFLHALAATRVTPGVMHGDFAPWNIKVSPRNQEWTVLDWERATLVGVPGWDWFHYEIQTAVLVDKLSVPRLIQKIDSLLISPDFQIYARRAGIGEICRPLVIAYLLHCTKMLQPAEGRQRLDDLMAAQLSLAEGKGGL